MSFDMRPMPPEPPDPDKRYYYNWMAAWFILSIAFTVLGIALLVADNTILGFVALFSSGLSMSRSIANYDQYDVLQRFKDD
jgi:hypothetical protein